MLYAGPDSDDSINYIKNAFSTRLFTFGFNFFSLFVPDLLHELELGVWKAIFMLGQARLSGYVAGLRIASSRQAGSAEQAMNDWSSVTDIYM